MQLTMLNALELKDEIRQSRRNGKSRDLERK